MEYLKTAFKLNPQSKELARRFNNIDKHITESQIKAETKITKHTTPFPWSPIVKNIYYKLLFIKQLVKRSPFKITINNYHKCIKYQIHPFSTLDEIITIYRKTHKEFQNKKLHSNQIREHFLQTRADFHFQYQNITSSSIIKQIIQTEKTRDMFQTIKFKINHKERQTII